MRRMIQIMQFLSFRDLCIGICLVILLASSGFGIVDGTSMHPSLKNNHLFIYSKVTKQTEPKVGDIVLIDSPDSDTYLVKRLIGVPSTRVYLNKGMVIGADDFLLTDVYLTESQLLADTEVVVVPPNQVYYIGDNQENSIDSRHTGTVPMSSIIGIVKVKF